MINQRRAIFDARLFTLHQVREIIVLFEVSGGLRHDGGKLLPERAVLDALDLPRQVDPAVPDFQRRQLGENLHSAAVGFDACRRERPRPVLGELDRQCRDGDARGQALEVHGEIDSRQRLVEIVDVEYDVLLRRRECPEVHEMAVAASLNGDAGCRLMPEVLGHDRGRPAQEGERACKHAFVTHRDQVRHAGAVARGEDGDRIAIGGPSRSAWRSRGTFLRSRLPSP